jgi:hypothetical protein
MIYPRSLTAMQTARLLILREFWIGKDSPWADAELTGEEIDQHWADNWDDIENIGGQNDMRYRGQRVPHNDVKNRIHHSWERHYDVEVRVIHLGDDRGLAYHYVSGGGKHGDPDAYTWWTEAWFVKCTGTKTVTTHTYEDIPEAPEAKE